MRRAEDALERHGALRLPVLQQAEDASAVVVEDHHLQVEVTFGSRHDEAAEVVQEGEVPHEHSCPCA